jgi:penicillin amidase
MLQRNNCLKIFKNNRLRFIMVLGLIALCAAGCSSGSDSGDDNTVPVAGITSPAEDSAYITGDSITFSGAGEDAEDGTLTDDALVWTSDKDGRIGTGQTFTVSDLSAGNHTVTLIATDSDGASGTALVKISVSASSVKTTRDDKGVWFISGPDDASLYDVFEAMGYAVATDRLWQAETYRRTARGKLAEIFGADQLESDILMRTLGYSDEELQAEFDKLDAETQTVIKAYTDGFNRRIAEIAGDSALLPFEFKALGFEPENWDIKDVMAWMAVMQRKFDPEALEQYQIYNMSLYSGLAAAFPNDFQAMFQDMRWSNDPDALTYIPAGAESRSATRTAVLNQSGSKIPDFKNLAARMTERYDTVTENLKKINAYVKMGSYAWSLSGKKTASGNPVIYSGPQMGFSTPSIVLEGSIRAGGLNVSGMAVAGMPGIIIGRTPHHAWSMQVANAHTTDYYLETPDKVSLHRIETVKVAGGEDIQLPVYRSAHGPVVNPLPYDPAQISETNPIISWKYSQWGYEFGGVKGFLTLSRATSMDEFGAGIELIGVSQHYCYADKDGNIAYWMSGRDPVRPAGNWFMPQGFGGTAPLEWDSAVLKPRSTDRNTAKGFYCGWNNKDSASSETGFNAASKQFGPFDRSHVLDDYISGKDKLTFEEIRDISLYIATTYSFDLGGNPWKFVKDEFSAAILVSSRPEPHEAGQILENWDGHFVEGGSANWAAGTDLADAWVLTDAWIREVLRLTFEDELGPLYDSEYPGVLFNVLLHGLRGESSAIVNQYNWFQNLSDPDAPQTPNEIILAALFNVYPKLGERPWGANERGETGYIHEVIGMPFVHTMPLSSRSTYAHCVEMGASGPVRIQSMFPLGESGNILMDEAGYPLFDDHFFSMTDLFDLFVHRDFPLFE